jgi:hypothetical protein
VVERPAGSGSAVQNPKGAATFSSGGFQYYYLDGLQPTFKADRPGTYRLRLHGELAFDDKVFPGNRAADRDLVLVITGAATEGCSTLPGQGSQLALWTALAAGLMLLRRKRLA